MSHRTALSPLQGDDVRVGSLALRAVAATALVAVAAVTVRSLVSVTIDRLTDPTPASAADLLLALCAAAAAAAVSRLATCALGCLGTWICQTLNGRAGAATPTARALVRAASLSSWVAIRTSPRLVRPLVVTLLGGGLLLGPVATAGAATGPAPAATSATTSASASASAGATPTTASLTGTLATTTPVPVPATPTSAVVASPAVDTPSVPAVPPSVGSASTGLPDARPISPAVELPSAQWQGLPDPGWIPERPSRAPLVPPDVSLVAAAPSRSITTTTGPSGSSAAGSGSTVAVRRGDTLWSIAARHLGARASDAEIARAWPAWWHANRDRIGDDPDLIKPGQLLRVPSTRTSATAPAATTPRNGASS